MIITEAQKQQYKDEGYFILEAVIPEHHLELLRDECQTFIDTMHARMDEQGTDTTVGDPPPDLPSRL